MPRWTFAQLFLLELAAAAGAGGWPHPGPWRIAGLTGAGALVLLALVPLSRRWLYQIAVSWVGMQRRRRRLAARPGLAGLLGEHEVISVPGGSNGVDLGAVRQGTTWCLPLVLGTDGVFNDDAAVPVRLLRELLQIEDVAVSSVRLMTVLAPAQVPPDAPSGPVPAPSPLAARYCLLTVDTRRAGDAVAARGGSPAAVAQILRRCAVHAEQTFATAGVPVRRLGVDDVQGLFPAWLGPATRQEGRRADRTSESWGEVRVAGTVGTVFAVTGSGPDVLDRVGRLAAAAAASVVGTALVLRRAGSAPRPANAATGRDPVGRVATTLMLRVSRPDGSGDTGHAGVRALGLLARAYDLVLQPLGGEQAALLPVTLPVGIGEPA